MDFGMCAACKGTKSQVAQNNEPIIVRLEVCPLCCGTGQDRIVQMLAQSLGSSDLLVLTANGKLYRMTRLARSGPIIESVIFTAIEMASSS